MRGHLPVLIIALGMTGSAAAATDDRISFESLDGDRDGFVSRDEAPADHPLSRTFREHDVDGDGQLSRAEFDAFLSSAGERRPPAEEF
jgi:Ca2+-binding EF-hand superfamily protein